VNLVETLRLEINPEDQRTFGPCDCCGQKTQRVWGYILQGEAALAAYFVEWTKGHADHEANFDLIYGRWGDDTTPSDRQAIAVAFRHLSSGPSFMVIEALSRPIGNNSLAGTATTRTQILNGPLREITFAMCDVIYLSDPRISVLHSAN
jgi:hypothetical protein